MSHKTENNQFLLDNVYNALENLGIKYAQTKSLATIAGSVDTTEFEPTTLSEYWGIILEYLESAENIRVNLLQLIQKS